MIRRVLLILAAMVPLAVASPAQAVEPGLALTGQESVDAGAEASALGSGWVRMFVDWSTFEPADNHYELFWERHFNARIDAANRHGQKVLLVVVRSPSWASGSGNVNTPPADAAPYAEFMGHLAREYKGRVSAYEVWNEPDEAAFWSSGPNAGAYARLLNASYDAVKAVDSDATVVVGGLTGNNYRFLEEVIDAGGTKFDAVGVHTDTACLTSPADEQYREPDGRIGRYSFTGYREVRQSLVARGLDRPIWMTEMGWSTLTSTCSVGTRAGTKPSGVSPELQARYLTQAMGCLARDTYVTHAFWFTLQDIGGEERYDHFLGLMGTDGSRKPAYDAFRNFATSARAPGACATDVDVVVPTVTLLTPTQSTPFIDKLAVKATATDDVGVSGMELFVDGVKIGGKQTGGSFTLDWHGAKDLAIGEHKLVVKAYDNAKNVGEVSTIVLRADPKRLKVPTATMKLAFKKGKGRRITVSGGRVSALNSPVQPQGRVQVFFEYQKLVKKGKKKVKVWKPFSRFTKSARKPFKFTFKVRKPGVWRAYARYEGVAPFKPYKTAYTNLGRVR